MRQNDPLSLFEGPSEWFLWMKVYCVMLHADAAVAMFSMLACEIVLAPFSLSCFLFHSLSAPPPIYRVA